MNNFRRRSAWQSLLHVLICLTIIAGISGAVFAPSSRGQEATEESVVQDGEETFPTEAPTEVATETPEPPPTETPVPEPTEAPPPPTETAVSTGIPTDVPTATTGAEEPAADEPTNTPLPTWEPFRDDFEAGDLREWERVDGLAVQSQVVLDGAFSARAVSSGNPAEAWASLAMPQSDVYARVRVMVVDQGANPVTILRLRGGDNEPIVSFYVDVDGNLASRNDVIDERDASTVRLAPGTWHELIVHLRIDGPSSLLEVFVDNNRVDELSGTTTFGTTSVGLLRLGESATGRQFDIAFDGVLVDREEIRSDPRFRVAPTPASEPVVEPDTVEVDEPAPTSTATPSPSPTTVPIEDAPETTVDIDTRPYSEADGLVVIEAEHAHDSAVAADGHAWITRGPLEDSQGAGYVKAEPDDGTAINAGYDDAGASPSLSYSVAIANPGTYYVWVRGWAASGGSDSVHAGLDGLGVASADRIRFDTQGAWTWTSMTLDGDPATLLIGEAGVHTVDLWMREDGLRVDRLLLTTDPGFVPSGSGPAESARTDDTNLQVASDDDLVSAAAIDDPAFQESGGQVVAEAENAHTTIARNGETWTLVTAPAGFAGTGALQALPDDGGFFGTNYATRSPQIDLRIAFATTGTYYVWVRAWGPDPNGDSLHAGLNGQEAASSDKIQTSTAGWAWTRNTMDGVPATLSVPTAGEHTLNLWMREDGVAVDRVLLTSDPNFTPTGTGPAESSRVGEPTPTATPPGAGGLWETRTGNSLNRQEVSYVHLDGKFYLTGGGTLHEVYDPATDSWSTAAPLPSWRDHIQGVAVNGKIYYIGGLQGWPDGDQNTVFIYDPVTNSFDNGTPMPRSRGAGGTAVYDGKIYYAGGLNNGSAVAWFDVYDPVADTWTQLPDMPRAREHFHAAIVNGKFYAIGGRTTTINSTMTANDAFDFSTGQWESGLAPLPTARGGFAAAVLGDEVLIIGGEGGGAHDEVEAYNTATNSWRTLTPMPTARHGIQAAVCNGGVYIAAGGESEGGSNPSTVHEVFFLNGVTSCTGSGGGTPTPTPTPTLAPPSDGPTSVGWSRAQDAPVQRAEAQGGMVNGKLYVLGGYDSFSPIHGTNRADVYDPVTDTWTQLPNMPVALTHGGNAIDGGDIYIVGGYVWSGSSETFGTTDVWKFNVNTQQWTQMPSLPAARGGGAAAIVGRDLHFVGGNDPTQANKGDHWVLDLDNPGTGWQSLAPMPNPRNHVGGTAYGGKIYVFGGQLGLASNAVTQSDVHEYDPASNTWRQMASVAEPLSHIAASTFVLDDRIIIIGGERAHEDHVANVRAFHPPSNTWQELTPLPIARNSCVGGHLNGVLYCATGSMWVFTYKGVFDGASATSTQTPTGTPVSTPTPTPTSTATAPSGDGAFQESGGQVVAEAENAQSNLARNGDVWTPVTAPAGFAGSSALQALPDDGGFFGSNYATRSPQLNYTIDFATTGTYYVWVRAWGPNPNGDSLHAGLNGQEVASADRIQTSTSGWAWTRNTMDGAPATLVIPAAGQYTVNLWMREDGVAVDRLLLTTDPNFTPTGTGPNESPRSGSGTATPTPTPTRTATPTPTPTLTPTPSGTPGTATDIKINFQPASASVPSGYTADAGLGFDATRGYGWVAAGSSTPLDMTVNARLRSSPTDLRLRSLMHMQWSGLDGSWEYALPNGSYTVTVSVGDADYFNSTHRVVVEGVVAIDSFVPAAGEPFRSATVTVNVSDGRLTVAATGGVNTKINYVDIADGATGPTPTPTSTSTPQTSTPTPTATSTAPSGDGAFEEIGGQVVAEAENAHDNIPRNNVAWTSVTNLAGFSGSAAMHVLPDSGGFAGSSYAASSPQLTFDVAFVTTGTYYVWVRGWGANPNGDSLHAGLNGLEIPSADRIQTGTGGWTWTRSTMDGSPATLEVTSAGLQSVELWMREDGVAVDRILLTTDPNFVPTGVGPAESPRTGGGTATPTPNPTATTTPGPGASLELENGDIVPFADRIAFSRIGTLANPPSGSGVHDRSTLRLRNSGSDPLDVTGLDITGPWTIDPPISLPAFIPPGSSLDVTLVFVAEGGDLNTGSLTITTTDPDAPTVDVELAGFWQSVPEGGQEPSLQEAIDVFGYATDMGTNAELNNAGRVETVGDEELIPYWEVADPSQPVVVYQLAAYHGASINGIFAWHAKGSSATVPLTDSAASDNQTILPRQTDSASLLARASFTPSSTVFGLWLDGEWSDPTLNDPSGDEAKGCTGACGHHVRVWPAKDRSGQIIPNAYLVGMDYRSINYDFQDTVYLITNVMPEQPGSATPTPTPGPGVVPARVNFQPASSSAPIGYVGDTGLPFDAVRGYGWVRQDSLGNNPATPLDNSGNTRDRNRVGIDQRLDTIIHMQLGTAAAWEYTLANGRYSVTVSVGDMAFSGVYDSIHLINIEGTTAIAGFQADASHEYELATVTVDVTDGRLTIDATGGSNTKLNFVEIFAIAPGVDHPVVTASDPPPGATNVLRTAAVNIDVSLPNAGFGVDSTTLNSANVQLYRTSNNAIVAGTINTTGGADAIVYQPDTILAANTNYTFRITDGVKDQAGISFEPFSFTFTTGTEPASTFPPVSFEKVQLHSADSAISTVVIGPDHRLYAAFLDGTLKRWDIATDGTLLNEQTYVGGGLAGRAIIGLAFDPGNAAVLWISHNDPIYPQPAADFTGRISRLTLGGAGFSGTLEDYVVGLPRSAKDHLTNSLAFGPDGMLYVTQGSTSAMGAPDNAWDNRPERMLSAAVLRINPGWGGGLPIDVRTPDGGGSYDPFAAGAPVTIFAAGVRNAYDLVWHSNGFLYVPTNGSAAGGNTPSSPAGVNPVVPGLTGVRTQNDFLYAIPTAGGGYYGHPNPELGHYVLNGGNPSSAVDPAEVIQVLAADGSVLYEGYPVGIAPDAQYGYFAWDFGRNRSPNGAIEYTSDTFGGEIRHKLLVVEYSGGDDILILTPGANGTIVSAEVLGVPAGLTNPLDIIEDPTNGNIYVVELVTFGFTGANGVISVLRPEQ